MLIEKITNEEFDMIDYYRTNYIENNRGEYYMPSRELLKVWERAKSEYLDKLFGGKLILTKHLNFTKTEDELADEIGRMMDGSTSFGRSARDGKVFINDYTSLFWKKSYSFYDDIEIRTALSKLISSDALINNYYDGDDIKIPLPNGKNYTLRHGSKPMRSLHKLAEAFSLRGFEDFRICHSQILNQKDLGGDLTISIHPLDYITMSENDCGWDSCMSWYNGGGYRQGTVEMMNSKCVIVAYLAAEEPMEIYPSFWNNKKWRQLFVVDKNTILGVKGYPYQNEELTCAVLEWLRELAETHLGWTYGEIVKTTEDFNGVILPDGASVSIRLLADQMYSDWGALKYHYVLFNMNILVDNLTRSVYPNTYIYEIEYSGESQCMFCGKTGNNIDFGDESCLVCYSCQGGKSCDCCKEQVYDDDYYVIDDKVVCQSCYDEYVAECCVCNDEHFSDYMKQIYVIPHWTPEEMSELREKIIKNDNNKYYNRKAFYDMPEIVTMNRNFPQFNICDDNCFETFCNEYLKEGCRPGIWRVEHNTYICVYWDDLTDEAKEEVYYPASDYKEDAFNEEGCFSAYFAQKLKNI